MPFVLLVVPVFMTRVAVIGVGHLGKQHARIYAELGHLAGVVDILESRANEVAAQYKTTAYTDYRELFGKVDAVSLAVPATDHARIGIDVLEHGIDVLVEKPVASTREQAEALIEAAQQNTAALTQMKTVEEFTEHAGIDCPQDFAAESAIGGGDPA